MRRQVITGGAIVVISVASAAAYNIVQGRWFNAATRNATQAETVSGASPTAENQAEGPRAAAVGAGWPVPGGTTESAPSAAQSATVAQAGARPLQATPQATMPPAAAKPAIACANPNAMGVSRVVEIDTGGGPGFGSQHFKTSDFL